jgi:hypothetical protein
MIFVNYDQLVQSADGKVFDFLKRREARPVLILPGETRPAKKAKRSVKNRRTLSWQKGRGFQFVAFFLQIEISFFDKHSESSVFG